MTGDSAIAAAVTVGEGRPDDPDAVIEYAGRALGSTLRLHVRIGTPTDARPALGAMPGLGATDQAAADRAWARVREEFDAVDLALSRFRDDSELTALNRRAGSGGIAAVSWRLRTALAAVHRAGRLTDGRFDARVLGALERLGEHGAALGRVAPDPDPASAAPRPGIRPVPASHVRVPEVPLDMGGIGKGLALRWAAAAAWAELGDGAGLLLEAGGDIVHAGVPPIDGWMVGIEDPVAVPGTEAEPVAVAAVREGAVATSSVRVRHWIGPDGRPVHHLLDPRTGEPARSGLIAVTVAAADPAWAEVWSKALFLAGRAGIGEEARARGLAAWWVDERGALGMTPEARLRSAWVAEERLG